MRTLKKIFFVSLLVSLLLGVTFVTISHYQLAQPNTLTSPKLFTLNKGASFNQFAKKLKILGVIEHRFWLRSYVRIYPNLAQIKAGTYQISPKQPLKDVLQMVVNGTEHQFSITFIEGSTLKQWLTLLQNNQHIRHTIEKSQDIYQTVAQRLDLEHKHPEGLFYPDTYAFTHNTSDIEILQRAYQKMQQELSTAWQNRATGLPYNTPYEALIMASIIEKESGRHAEHEIIASVFINRLAKGMRLQTDPTVIYGLGERYKGDITRQHLRERTLYNTYRIDGLPPTPIAMPGLSALHAALQPSGSDYLYFVSDGAGKHIFSTNLIDHNKAVAKYQLN
ncbi:endolytic transglycosylase MltG [Thalassotalea sp. G2M2-11]|uniref:endolytic transglycosylase MltG n=1 Tax=Thalassotalea sp. G2M2-11 TaxID=2787627 RepID=UPI0019D08572|nr:endolytic transglycosylase MltG [Thalassotalea sp. G2M2-11]